MEHKRKNKIPLLLAAIGIVYGDLGTSPLYAFRESLKGLEIIPVNILGVLSLIFWALISLISIKYLVFVLRADNDGEGGILSMLSLIRKNNEKAFKMFLTVAILGTALLIGDGMITPAISVISAIEGLGIISPHLSHYTVPITIGILLVLYFCQHYGTAKIGSLFGPIIVVWFLTIGTLGALHITDNTLVFQALNPYYAINFFKTNGWTGYMLLGGVFLVVTGGEALYADMGQFGRSTIRFGWFCLALPALLLNYFGQGAYVLEHPEAITNPFYSLAPEWFAYPLLVISTLATIIASQAVISATFSIAKQAVLLDLIPKIPIIQTSSEEKGQVYVPQINLLLAIGTLIFVLTFKNSSNMAFAYGIAVNLEMITVTILMMYTARLVWKWSLPKIFGLLSIFLLIELAFFGSNMHKILSGGWVPILFAGFCLMIMITWYMGIQYLRTSFYKGKGDIKQNIMEFATEKLHSIPNTVAVFITEPYDKSTANLLQYFRLNRTVPEKVIIVSINTTNIPYVSSDARYELKQQSENIYTLNIHIGFMQLINIPVTLSHAKRRTELFPFEFDLKAVTYLVEITHISATERKSTLPFFWQEKLFAFLMRNSTLDIEFYHLPYNRTIAIGSYCEL